MQSFLALTASYIYAHYKDTVENLCIVMPNKRGALFLKQHLAATFGKTIWLPQIISAEESIDLLSGLTVINEVDAICLLYDSYQICYGAEAEPFDSFVKWGHLILQDFNEIDRYLADSEQLYENLKDIKEIENWSLGAEVLSPYQKNYLRFMNSLGAIYKHFKATLLAKRQAYQGLAYRQAVHNLETSDFSESFHKILFCGFNALNAAEEKIISHLVKKGKADLLWDADTYYYTDNMQEAGYFLRKNQALFPQKEFNFLGNYFNTPKQIDLVSVPKQIGQGLAVKQLVQQYIHQGIPLDKVAIVLANEKLLWPVLKLLPAGIEAVNITMEYPLRYTSPFSFFDLLIKMQVRRSGHSKQISFYHKELSDCLRQPFFNFYLQHHGLTQKVNSVIQYIQEKNHAFLTPAFLEQLFAADFKQLAPLFRPWQSASEAVTALQMLISESQLAIEANGLNMYTRLELEYLHVLQKNMNRVEEVVHHYPYFSSLQAFRQLFMQIVGTASVAFIGEPLRGLQIMGVLETRTLDFDHVIFVNVNEGVLPSGKSSHSFIPNDLKRAFQLPLYSERDAIYAYHFFRVLQRAKEIYITYDSETDTFGKGEKSRFVTQLQMEMAVRYPLLTITERVATLSEAPPPQTIPIAIEKNELTLTDIAHKLVDTGEFGGISASALNTFKECSLKFYYRYGAHLKEAQLLEESAEANTFGTVLHSTLEQLYKPSINVVISEQFLTTQLAVAATTVEKQFLNYFSKSDAATGKNVLQQEVLKAYVEKALKNDQRLVKKNQAHQTYLSLLGVEESITQTLPSLINGQWQTIIVKGTIDRLDRLGDRVRIIDYKTSVHLNDKFDFEHLDDLFEDPHYSKQFQLFLYAWLVYKSKGIAPEQLQPCIIAFKKFTETPITIKDKASKQTLVFTHELLAQFEARLQEQFQTIMNYQLPFVQTDDETRCLFCAYKLICER